MIRLYSAASPNSRKVEIALAELGLAWEDRPVDVRGGEQWESWFVARCPNSKIPVLEDGERTVWESGAILLYLAETRDPEARILSPQPAARWNAIQLAFFQAAGLGPNLGGLSTQLQRPESERNSEMVEIFAAEVDRIFGVLEHLLRDDRPYLAGDYSIADIMHYPWLQPVWGLGARQLTERPALVAWLERMSKRPAVASVYGD